MAASAVLTSSTHAGEKLAHLSVHISQDTALLFFKVSHWKCVILYENKALRVLTSACRCCRRPTNFGTSKQHYRVTLYHIVSCCVISYCISLYSIVSCCIISYRIVLYHIVFISPYRTVFHCIVKYHIVLYRIVLHVIVLYFIVSCHIVSYHIVSYCIVSDCIINFAISSFFVFFRCIFSRCDFPKEAGRLADGARR